MFISELEYLSFVAKYEAISKRAIELARIEHTKWLEDDCYISEIDANRIVVSMLDSCENKHNCYISLDELNMTDEEYKAKLVREKSTFRW